MHIGNVIEGFSAGSDINDLRRIVLSGGQTVLQLDFDGKANGSSFVSLAIMSGVSSGLSVDTLFANGQIDTCGSIPSERLNAPSYLDLRPRREEVRSA